MARPGGKSAETAIAVPLGGGARASPLRFGLSLAPLSRLLPLGAALAVEVERRRLFLWLPVLFGFGIVAYFAAEGEPALAAAAIPAGLAAVAAFALRQRLAPLAAALAVAFFFLGFVAAGVRTRHVAAPVLAAPVFLTVDGRIETLDRTAYGARLVVAVQDVSPAVERMPERIRVTVRGKVALESGAGVRFKARLTPPATAAVPGGFDFEREAFFQKLGAVGYSTGGVAAWEGAAPPTVRQRLVSAIDRARNALTERIIAVVGGSTGAIAAALITGKRGQIAERDNETWRAAGIYHLVSISGLHMMLAAGLFFWAARIAFALLPEAGRHPTKKWAALVAMAGAIAYDVFSGSDVATERALVMTLVMFGAILVDRPALAMRNLAISALVVMALRPETVLGPSFQMSFGAVAGLVAYGEIERRWHERHNRDAAHEAPALPGRILRFVIAFLMTSVIAGLATAPYQAFHFHRLNPFGILGNTLAVPLCSLLVMPSALIGVVLYPLGLDAPVWWVMGQGIAGISAFADWVSVLPGSVTATGRFGMAALTLMTLGLMLMTLMTTAPFRLAGVAVMLIGALAAARQTKPLLILDATGESAMVRTADGHLALLGRKKPWFAIQQWLTGDGDARNPRDPALGKAQACDPLGCTLTLPDGRAVALVLSVTAFAEDCERADILITPLAAPEWCWGRAELYDRAYFAAYGATYITGSAAAQRLETHRNARIDRPWHPKRTPEPAAPPASQASERIAPPEPTPRPAWDPDGPDVVP